MPASSMLPSAWTLIEINPAHVTEQRRVLGKRGIKTDQIDLAAMFDLLVVGPGQLVAARSEALAELQAWVAMRHRRITAMIAGSCSRPVAPCDPRAALATARH